LLSYLAAERWPQLILENSCPLRAGPMFPVNCSTFNAELFGGQCL